MAEIRQLKNIADNYDSYRKMGLSDTFLTGCSGCGRCCRDNITITLTPHDLYRIARATGLSTYEAAERFGFFTLGASTRLPVLSIRHDNSGSCPLLKGNKCGVDDHKPAVCRLYPLARSYQPLVDNAEIEYLAVNQPCGNSDLRGFTVREWIGGVASNNSQRIFKLWTEMIVCVSMTLSVYRSAIPKAAHRPIAEAIAKLVYMLYDTKEPFLPQIERNYNNIKKMLAEILHIRVFTLDEVRQKAEMEMCG